MSLHNTLLTMKMVISKNPRGRLIIYPTDNTSVLVTWTQTKRSLYCFYGNVVSCIQVLTGSPPKNVCMSVCMWLLRTCLSWLPAPNSWGSGTLEFPSLGPGGKGGGDPTCCRRVWREKKHWGCLGVEKQEKCPELWTMKIKKKNLLAKMKFLVSLETQLCHVIFFWKLSYKRMFLLKQTWEDVLLKTDTWCFSGKCLERGHVMFC